MRVALCLSGHLRSYEDTYNFYRNYIIDPLKADVFIHTWDKIGLSPGIDVNLMHVKTESVKNKIESCFNPVSMIIEPIIIGAGEKYRKFLVDPRCPNGVTNMFYKIYKADQLRQEFETSQNFKYDVVIRARPDLHFSSGINQNDLEFACKNEVVFLPDFGHYDGLNDQFAFGSNQAMTNYANCFNSLDAIADKPFKPEPLLKKYLLLNNIPLKFSVINYTIRRGNGENFDNRKWSNGIPKL